MLPSISFETGRKTQTQSSEQLQKAASANGRLVLLRKKKPRPRGQHTRRRITKNLHPRSSVARRESFALLTKTYHGSRVTGQVLLADPHEKQGLRVAARARA